MYYVSTANAKRVLHTSTAVDQSKSSAVTEKANPVFSPPASDNKLPDIFGRGLVITERERESMSYIVPHYFSGRDSKLLLFVVSMASLISTTLCLTSATHFVTKFSVT